jgi:hypothetical protein
MSWTVGNHGGMGFRSNRGGEPPSRVPQWPGTPRQNFLDQNSQNPPGHSSQNHSHQQVGLPRSNTPTAIDICKSNERPPPPTSSFENTASVFPRRLFTATSPAEDRNHPDDLINGIPFHERAIADFNSNSAQRLPFRDIPSILITALTNPVPGPVPNWGTMMVNHFPTATAIQPVSNLQDLYLWVTRVGIPNAIIDNRRFMLHFYLRNPNASMNLSLRYNAVASIETYVPLGKVPRASPPNTIPNHSVFRDYPTPSGARFVL